MANVSDSQASITAAFVLIGVLLAAKNGWFQSIAKWASSGVSNA